MPELELKEPNLLQGSAIKKAGFSSFLSRLFGFQRSGSNRNNIEFVKTDIGSKDRVGQALLNNRVEKNSLSERLESLYQYWLTDTTDIITDLSNRTSRVSQIQYMVLNDPYVNRTVALYADEATQLDEQDTVLGIETPNPRMTRDMYKLASQWGLTQTRIRETIEQLATFGDAFWANSISEKGVERIIPLQQLQVSNRIEFNPVKALESKKRREGSFYTFAAKNYLITKMLDELGNTDDFADMFDTKLFGFQIANDLVVPPWSITHFRVGAGTSEFWPFGTSPILGALAPYKQTQSSITLQSLARLMSFPITIYKVKTNENMDEGRQFATVNRVRESYDNIGVNPMAGNSEVYSVNTKIWVPDGLLEVEVKKPEISSTDGVDDIRLYQEREAVALGLPKSFFMGDGGWYTGIGNSGKALIQQYKPFARKVYSLQSAFLESLADLFRIHFAITGQYDFRIPFTLSMKYPATEETDEKNRSKKDSIELAGEVVKLIKTVIGAGDEDILPPDIMRDIVGKYTFLDAADIMKWTRDARYDKLTTTATEEEDLGMEGLGMEDIGSEDIGSIESNVEEIESPEEVEFEEPTIEEKKKSEQDRLREKQLIKNYKEKKEDIYFQVLRESAIDGFIRNNQHIQVFNNISNENELMLRTLSEASSPEPVKLRERKRKKK